MEPATHVVPAISLHRHIASKPETVSGFAMKGTRCYKEKHFGIPAVLVYRVRK